MTNPRKVYRDAAQLAAIQLDRPFTAQEIARIEACNGCPGKGKTGWGNGGGNGDE